MYELKGLALTPDHGIQAQNTNIRSLRDPIQTFFSGEGMSYTPGYRIQGSTLDRITEVERRSDLRQGDHVAPAKMKRDAVRTRTRSQLCVDLNVAHDDTGAPNYQGFIGMDIMY